MNTFFRGVCWRKGPFRKTCSDCIGRISLRRSRGEKNREQEPGRWMEVDRKDRDIIRGFVLKLLRFDRGCRHESPLAGNHRDFQPGLGMLPVKKEDGRSCVTKNQYGYPE